VEGLGHLKPYVIKELKGIRVALIGIVTEDVPLSTHPRNVANLKFISPIETVGKYIRELKRRLM
jgi:5'-nucleotidase / UDP-sugar diphosphatase